MYVLASSTKIKPFKGDVWSHVLRSTSCATKEWIPSDTYNDVYHMRKLKKQTEKTNQRMGELKNTGIANKSIEGHILY
jgi:hypothetical protein